MTVAQVKEQLPGIDVRMSDGTYKPGIISGRSLPYAQVYVRLGVGDEWTFAGEWAWETVAHCVTNCKALRA
jgi:hypothetical protein